MDYTDGAFARCRLARSSTIQGAREASLDEDTADSAGIDIDEVGYNVNGDIIFDGGSYSSGPVNLVGSGSAEQSDAEPAGETEEDILDESELEERDDGEEGKRLLQLSWLAYARALEMLLPVAQISLSKTGKK